MSSSGGGAPDLPALTARLRSAGCVFAEEEAGLLAQAARDPAHLGELAALRIAGRPLEQVLGWVDFDTMRLRLRPGVFVPRQRTAFLVQEAARSTQPASRVADLCCGAGPVAAGVARRRPDLDLLAADRDPTAVSVARENLPETVAVYCGDLLEALPDRLRGTLAMIVANTPYVPSGEVSSLPPEARDHEPRATLDGGSDGLDVQRRLVREAPHWLAGGGWVLTEIAGMQADAATAAFAAAGFNASAEISERWGSGVVLAQLRDQGAAA